MSQREKVLADLQYAAEVGGFHGRLVGVVCGSEWLRDYMPRYAARVGELRDLGFVIETVTKRCPLHKTAVYRLTLGQ